MDSMEEALSKTGPELFKELLRVFPVAEVEDYYKNGAWKNELVKTDLVLISAHRKEAGAPEPPSLDEVVMPEMPKTTSYSFFAANGAGLAAAAGAVSPGAAVAEVRLIALFVAKWKLEPVKAKGMLAKMLPHRRRYIIQNFKSTAEAGEAESPEEVLAKLEAFIAESESTNAWGNAPVVPVHSLTPRPAGMSLVQMLSRPVLMGTQSGPFAGVKRPLASFMPVSAAFDPNKRLRPATPLLSMIRPVSAAFGARPAWPTTPRAGFAAIRPVLGMRPGLRPAFSPSLAFGMRPALSFGAAPRFASPLTRMPLFASMRPMFQPAAVRPMAYRPMMPRFPGLAGRGY